MQASPHVHASPHLQEDFPQALAGAQVQLSPHVHASPQSPAQVHFAQVQLSPHVHASPPFPPQAHFTQVQLSPHVHASPPLPPQAHLESDIVGIEAGEGCGGRRESKRGTWQNAQRCLLGARGQTRDCTETTILCFKTTMSCHLVILLFAERNLGLWLGLLVG